MAFWRMQLHPERIDRARDLALESLERGYVGLDFRGKVGNLSVSHDGTEKGQRPYRLIQSEMAVGDLVLIQVGEEPLALAEVEGDYEFEPDPKNARGVWFRHMRKVGNVRYYDVYIQSGATRERLPLRPALQAVRRTDQPAYRLIERWRNPR